MFTLTVPAEYIAVLKLFAAVKDVRHYLNGIALEIGATESRLVATNGVILGYFRVVSEQPKPLTNIIIPHDLLKHIKPNGVVEITIGPRQAEDNGRSEKASMLYSRPVSIVHAGMSVSGQTIDSVFPDYRSVIPSKVSGQPAQFDARLFCTLAKAWSILHGNKDPHLVGIGYNGQGPALINLANDNFTGIIMPLREGAVNVPVEPPAWFTDTDVRGLL